ncbi:hypothetical protein VPHF86_0175 [Vibrio phage F86]
MSQHYFRVFAHVCCVTCLNTMIHTYTVSGS